MKNIKPFGPSIGKTKISKKFLDILNKEIDNKVLTKKNDYSSKLASQIKKIKDIKILNLWVVSQFKDEYNPIHYHDGDLSGVGYLKVPKNMTKNKFLKSKKNKTNGTIDFINGQKGFLSKSIYNVVPKERDLIIFPNYLMHTAYPFNINSERRSFSFNAKIILKR